jgi:hypothetical protein
MQFVGLLQPACRNNDTIHVDDYFAQNETKNFPRPCGNA